VKQKQTFKIIFALLAILLVTLPFVTTFNSFLTSLVENTKAYRFIQQTILPWEIKIVGVVLQFLGIGVQAGQDTLYLTKAGKNVAVYIAWNCLGWQSLFLLIISLIVGLQGSFTLASKLICGAIGFLGIFLFNIFRMVVVAIGIFYINQIFALILHDYLTALMTILWLFVFWWFSYAFVLEERIPKVD